MNTNLSSTSHRDTASAFNSFALLSCAIVLSLVSLLSPCAAHADVPGRVGRIAFMEGDVQAYSETDPEWKVAYLNQPITSRNSLFVGNTGRAEISVGSTTLAMDAGSQVDIQQLDDNTFDANVVRGRVSLRVRRFDPNDAYSVAVPGAVFALLKPGRYRIDALPSSGGITVFAGQASTDSDRGTTLIAAGNGLRVVGNASDPNVAPQLMSAAPTPVPLDDWVVARETRFRNSQSERYVSQNMTGYEDLDANGRWSNEEDVGPVWYPTTYVQQDWAPYRYGRWAYVAPWGYTWIDDAPWGFAPFHYGRWVQVNDRWGWAPGSYVARPAYAPALVGFYGGDGFSASFSVGVGPAVGWYPLAPWQRYSPSYTRNAVYVNQVNNITIVNAPRRFGGGDGGRDWNREHGGVLAPQEAFASQRSISRIAIAAPRNLPDRGRPIDVGNLPRPAQIPGAVRRGPEQDNGNGRPDFRSPREFAGRQNNEAGQRNGEHGGRPSAPVVNAPDRNGLPPSYRRLPEDRRPNAAVEAARPATAPVQPVPPEVPVQQPRGGGFNRERPQPQQPVVQGAQPIEGQSGAQPRYTPRVQPGRNEGDTRIEQRPQPMQPQPTQPQPMQPQPAAQERTFDRPNQGRAFEQPNREMRNTQQAPQPQVVEQPQQRFERPAPQQVQPQAVERQQQQRFEKPVAPQPQAPQIERPQRIERQAPPPPQVAPPAPVAPAVQPRPQPQPQPAREQPAQRVDGGPRQLNNDR